MIVGILGKMRVGKDTVADYLVSNHGFVKKAFADPLKEICKILFLFNDDQLYGTDEQKKMPDDRWFGCSARTAQQFIGTELFRNNLNKIMPGLNQDIFIHHLKLWLEDQKKTNPNIKIVVSDVRFQNEVDFIHSIGGTVIRVTKNPPNTLTDTITKNPPNTLTDTVTKNPPNTPMYSTYTITDRIRIHSSETESDSITNYNYSITNNSTINDLYEKVEKLLEQIK